MNFGLFDGRDDNKHNSIGLVKISNIFVTQDEFHDGTEPCERRLFYVKSEMNMAMYRLLGRDPGVAMSQQEARICLSINHCIHSHHHGAKDAEAMHSLIPHIPVSVF